MLSKVTFRIRSSTIDDDGRYRQASIRMVTVDDAEALARQCVNYPKYLDAIIMHSLTHVRDTVRSCYGSGRWLPNKPWLGNDRWRGK